MHSYVALSLLLLTAVLVGTSLAKDMTAYCGACKAVVDELQYAIKSTDPLKTLQTGSFRVDSRGQQRGVKEKRYAGSEVHLTELLENVCDLMQNYGVSTDSSGAKSYMRINSRDGETITISNMSFSSDGSRDLTNATGKLGDQATFDFMFHRLEQLAAKCHYFVSEYEDDLIDLFTEKAKNIEKELCYDVTGYCRYQRSEL